MLRMKALQFGYKGNPILKEPTSTDAFNFNSSEFITLIGRNGSGKSTLLRVLSGLMRPLQGELILDNINYTDYSTNDFAKKLSIVTTERIDYPFLSVWELVALGRHPHLGFGGKLTEKDKLIISEALDKIGIAHLTQKMISKCSDGERQSVMLARALAQETKIMLLDEVTAHLDFVHRHQSFELLQELAQKEQKLIIMATHEIELALQYSHRILLLYNGKLSIFSPESLKKSRLLESIFKGYMHS